MALSASDSAQCAVVQGQSDSPFRNSLARNSVVIACKITWCVLLEIRTPQSATRQMEKEIPALLLAIGCLATSGGKRAIPLCGPLEIR